MVCQENVSCESRCTKTQSVECQECLQVSMVVFGNVLNTSGVIWECLEISEVVSECLGGIGGCMLGGAEG